MTDDQQTPPARRVIRLFPDYSRRYPLWEDSTPTWDVGYTTTPGTYGLSPELAAELERWQAFWEDHHDPFEGWDAPQQRDAWLRDGERLTNLLRAEVSSFADVAPEFDRE